MNHRNFKLAASDKFAAFVLLCAAASAMNACTGNVESCCDIANYTDTERQVCHEYASVYHVNFGEADADSDDITCETAPYGIRMNEFKTKLKYAVQCCQDLTPTPGSTQLEKDLYMSCMLVDMAEPPVCDAEVRIRLLAEADKCCNANEKCRELYVTSGGKTCNPQAQ